MSLAAVNRDRRKEKEAVSSGAARRTFRAGCALGSRAGFTLTEALATVIIVGLVTAILASGVALATRQYTQSMTNSEAQMLYSSLQKILDTELRYTGAITESGGQVTGFSSKHYKARETVEDTGSSYVATENLCTFVEGTDGVLISSPDTPGQLAMTSSFDAATAVYSPLLGSGAYNYGLQASIPSITYDDTIGYFIVNLVISKGTGNNSQVIVSETFTVRAMNLAKSKNSGGPQNPKPEPEPEPEPEPGSNYDIAGLPVIDPIEVFDKFPEDQGSIALHQGDVIVYNEKLYIVNKQNITLSSDKNITPGNQNTTGNSDTYIPVGSTEITPETYDQYKNNLEDGMIYIDKTRKILQIYSHNKWIDINIDPDAWEELLKTSSAI